jgi:LysR family transcriptional regulator, mexEF-oprN operon transcriptional activator
MGTMTTAYGRDLDLNLLRVFVIVAEEGSVTAAASRLYLTQPAVSAALKRLAAAVGAPLLVRSGRGLALTARGRRLFTEARPHLEALVSASLSPPVFDPKTSDRTVRLGLSDVNEAWLLPPLLRALGREAPRMRLVVVPVQFRTVGDAFATSRVDLAVTVADELPAGVARRALFTGSFVCLFDPRHADVGKALTAKRYLAHDHVVVSYNGDLRGIVEDLLGVDRSVRISVPTFQSVGAIVEGSPLLATVPAMVARQILAERRHLATTPLPFALASTPMELLTRSAIADDEAVAFVTRHLVRIAEDAFAEKRAVTSRRTGSRRAAPRPPSRS